MCGKNSGREADFQLNDENSSKNGVGSSKSFRKALFGNSSEEIASSLRRVKPTPSSSEVFSFGTHMHLCSAHTIRLLWVCDSISASSNRCWWSAVASAVVYGPAHTHTPSVYALSHREPGVPTEIHAAAGPGVEPDRSTGQSRRPRPGSHRLTPSDRDWPCVTPSDRVWPGLAVSDPV